MTEQLPQNVEAEQAVLGAMLVDPDAIAAVADWLKPESFATSSHATIYHAMTALWSVRKPATITTLSDLLASRNRLEQVGGAAYLSHLMTSVDSPWYVGYHAEIVQRTARQRAMIDAACRIVAETHKGDLPVDDAAVMLRNAVEPFAPAGDARLSLADQTDALRSTVLARWSGELQETIVKTGITLLDRLLGGGLRGGELSVWAARPSMGKSGVMLAVARRYRSLVFSLEMPRDVCLNRLISSQAGVPYDVAMNAVRDVEQQNAWLTASGEVEGWPLQIIDDVRTTTAIEAMIAKTQAESGVDVVFIDHLGWLGDRFPERASEYNKMSFFSRRCKEIARNCNVPVVALSQLNREVEHRSGCLPYMSDLRESGKIEEDADHIMLMYRRRYYSERNMGGLKPDIEDYIAGRPAWDRLNLNVVKNRNGAVGSVDVGWEGKSMRVHDVDERLAA